MILESLAGAKHAKLNQTLRLAWDLNVREHRMGVWSSPLEGDLTSIISYTANIEFPGGAEVHIRNADLDSLCRMVEALKAVQYSGADKREPAPVNAPPPTDAYQAGYADGVDEAARQAGHENPTDEQIDEFFLNL